MSEQKVYIVKEDESPPYCKGCWNEKESCGTPCQSCDKPKEWDIYILRIFTKRKKAQPKSEKCRYNKKNDCNDCEFEGCPNWGASLEEIDLEKAEPKSEMEDVEASLKQIAEGKSRKSGDVEEFLEELKESDKNEGN